MSPARAVLEECTAAVRDMVEAHRARSGSVKRAVQIVADAIGLTARRIEAYWWREAASVPAHEADAIRRALAAVHAEEAARLAAELDRHWRAKRAAREALRPVLYLKPPAPPRQQGRLPL